MEDISFIKEKSIWKAYNAHGKLIGRHMHLGKVMRSVEIYLIAKAEEKGL